MFGPFRTTRNPGNGAPVRRLLAILFVFSIALTLSVEKAQARYAAIIVDADTGRVLYERNADTRNYPASLTKMMTLYMLFEAMDQGKATLNTRMPVSRRAAGQPPTKLGLKAGESIRVETAIKALVTKSANDVATVVGEFLGGTESRFAQMMTKRARRLGMTRTTFRNASGLPNKGQLSTARDMAALSIALRRDFPQYYHYFSTEAFQFRGRTVRTHNKVLLHYAGADGLKTGYTRASGFNLAASVVRPGASLVGVVFGGKTSKWRDRHMMSLLDKGYREVQKLASLPAPLRKPIPPSSNGTEVAALGAPAAFSVINDTRVSAQTPAPTQTPTPAQPAPAAQGDWGVQVGAFSAFGTARGQAEKAVAELDTGRIRITPVSTDSGLIYRARVIGFATEGAARQACTRLQRSDQSCVVIPPGGIDVAYMRDNG